MLDRQVRQLTRLVDDLLDVSRISRGKIQLRASRSTSRSSPRSAAAAVAPMAEERGHDLSVAIEPESISIVADPTRLEQVVVNLLTNAMKYTEPGGRIELGAAPSRATRSSGSATTASGIAPDLLPRIFDLFTQGDRSLAR